MSFQPHTSNVNRNSLRQCCHRVNTGCVLSATNACCACMDQRPNAPAYPVYIDGEGIRYQGTRWGSYCWRCRGMFMSLLLHLYSSPKHHLAKTSHSLCKYLLFVITDYWNAISYSQCSPNSTFINPFTPPSLQAIDPVSTPQNPDTSYEQSGRPTSPARQLSRLRTELRDLRSGIQRVISGSQVQGDNNPPNSTPTETYTMPPDNRELSTSGPQPQAGLQSSNWAPPPSAISPQRYYSESSQAQRSNDLIARQRAFLESSQSTTSNPTPTPNTRPPNFRRPRRGNVRRTEPVYPLGTREDVENPDYQSPVGAMFGRAWDRYRTAEEMRRLAAQTEDHMQPTHPHLPELPTSTVNPNSHGHPATYPQTESSTLQSYNPFNPFAADQPNLFHPLDSIPHPTFTLPPVNLPTGAERRIPQFDFHQQRPHPSDSGRPPRRSHRSETPDLMLENLGHGPHYLPPNLASLHEAYYSMIPHSQSRRLFSGYADHAHLEDSESETDAVTFDSQPRPPPMKPEEMMRDLSCTICKEHMVDTIVMPCMHAVMCNWCADLQVPSKAGMPSVPKDRSAKCPVCRTRVKSKARIYHS
jgi:hypothetical protein